MENKIFDSSESELQLNRNTVKFEKLAIRFINNVGSINLQPCDAKEVNIKHFEDNTIILTTKESERIKIYSCSKCLCIEKTQEIIRLIFDLEDFK